MPRSPARSFVEVRAPQVLGPSGSGEHLRQQRTPFVDGLVHGTRRWFTMSPKNFQKLRSLAAAAETLEPSSAFVRATRAVLPLYFNSRVFERSQRCQEKRIHRSRDLEER